MTDTDPDNETTDTTIDVDPVELHRNAIASRPFGPPPPGPPTAADAGIGGRPDTPSDDPVGLHRRLTGRRTFRAGITGYPIQNRI